MADAILNELVARNTSMGTRPGQLRPRFRSRFEDGFAVGDGPVEPETDEAGIEPHRPERSRVEASTPEAAPDASPSLVRVEHVSGEDVDTRKKRPVETRAETAPAAAESLPTNPEAAPGSAPVDRARRSRAADPLTPTRRVRETEPAPGNAGSAAGPPGRAAGPPVADPQPAAPAQKPQPPAGLSVHGRAPAVPERAEPVAQTRKKRPEPLRAETRPATVRESQPRETGASELSTPSPTPTSTHVEVRVGRIEIRVPEAKEKPRVAAPRQSRAPAVSLEDYLDRRNGGDR